MYNMRWPRTGSCVRDKGVQGRELGGREVEGGMIKIGYDIICLYDMICMIYNNMICI